MSDRLWRLRRPWWWLRWKVGHPAKVRRHAPNGIYVIQREDIYRRPVLRVSVQNPYSSESASGFVPEEKP